MSESVEIVRDLLESLHIIWSESTNVREYLARLEAAATKTTTHLTGMPGGGQKDSEALLAKLADARNQWADIVMRYVVATSVVTDFINGSPLSDREKNIMLGRYVENRTWPRVLKLVNKTEPIITERTMYRMHNKAFDKLVEYYDKGGLSEETTNLIREVIQR